MLWKIKVTRRFERDFRKLESNTQDRIIKLIQELRRRPFIGKRLRGMPYFSLRIGDYKVIYLINREERCIILVTIFHRKVGYRRI